MNIIIPLYFLFSINFSYAGKPSCVLKNLRNNTTIDNVAISNSVQMKKNLSELNMFNSKLDKKIHINDNNLVEYIKSNKASNTAEVIWFPSPMGTPKTGTGGSGHLGIRIDDRIYHMTSKGIRNESFVSHSNSRFKKGHSFYGYSFEVSNIEKERIISTFKKNKRFHLYLQNCSQTVCESLDSAGIVNVNTILATDPIIAKKIISKLKRPGYHTVFTRNANHPPPAEITANNLLFRTTILGGASTLGLSVAVGASIVFGAVEASIALSKVLEMEDLTLSP